TNRQSPLGGRSNRVEPNLDCGGRLYPRSQCPVIAARNVKCFYVARPSFSATRTTWCLTPMALWTISRRDGDHGAPNHIANCHRLVASICEAGCRAVSRERGFCWGHDTSVLAGRLHHRWTTSTDHDQCSGSDCAANLVRNMAPLPQPSYR